MPRAFLGLGSNLGDRDATLRGAIAALHEMPDVEVVQVSRFIETSPQGGPPQPDYLNAVAEIETSLSPGQLLHLLQAIENGFGRVREDRWGPRTLDLDLLLYGQRVVDEPDLTLPHPRMHLRAFVLAPLAEIAPDVPHPVLGKSARALLESMAPPASPG